jgi:hypothetical protein
VTPDRTVQIAETNGTYAVLNIVFHRCRKRRVGRRAGSHSTSHVAETKDIDNVLNSVIHNCVYCGLRLRRYSAGRYR